jgi:hypothetical protein
MEHSSSRRRLAECLLRDAELQDSRRGEIGHDFDEVDASVKRDDLDLAIAIAFWDAWLDERNHGFPGNYEGISKPDWPVLARHIATSLASGEAITEPRLRKNFVF